MQDWTVSKYKLGFKLLLDENRDDQTAQVSDCIKSIFATDDT